MSVKIMGAVWDLELSHSKRLVLLAMADHADHTGGNVYPSVGLVAWKTGYSERQVQRIIQDLRDEKLLIEVEPATPRSPATYKIDISAGKQKPEFKPERQNVTPAKSQNVTPGVTKSQVRGDIAMSPDPSLEPSIKPSEESLPQPSVTVSEPISNVTALPKPAYIAPPGTRWIYPLDGIHCHLVRDANQPTTTLCGISPLPSYAGGGQTTQVQCAECLKATEKRPKPEPLQESSDPKKKSSGKRKKADVPAPADGVLDAVCVLCYGTIDAFRLNAASIRQAYNKIAACCAPVTLDELRAFYLWWKREDWRGKKGQPPRPYQVSEQWATFKATVTKSGALSYEPRPNDDKHTGSGNSSTGEGGAGKILSTAELFPGIDDPERVARIDRLMRTVQGNGVLRPGKAG